MNLTIISSQQTINGDENKKIVKYDISYTSNNKICKHLCINEGGGNIIIANLQSITEFRSLNKNLKSPYDLFLITPDGTIIRTILKDSLIGVGNVQGNDTNSFGEINFKDICKIENIDNINVFLNDHYTRAYVSRELILREITDDLELFKHNILSILSTIASKNIRITLFINMNLQNHFTKYGFAPSSIESFLNDGVYEGSKMFFVELSPFGEYSIVKRLSELYIGSVKSLSSEGFVKELEISGVIWFKDEPKCTISYNIERSVLNIKYNSSESCDFSIYVLVYTPNCELIDDSIIFTNIDYAVLEELFNYIICKKTDDISLQRSEIIKLNPYRFKLGENPLLIEQTSENTDINKIFASKLVQYVLNDICNKEFVLSNNLKSSIIGITDINDINDINDLPPKPPRALSRQQSCLANVQMAVSPYTYAS